MASAQTSNRSDGASSGPDGMRAQQEPTPLANLLATRLRNRESVIGANKPSVQSIAKSFFQFSEAVQVRYTIACPFEPQFFLTISPYT